MDIKEIKRKRVILDVDGICANFIKGMFEYAGEQGLMDQIRFKSESEVDCWEFFENGIWEKVKRSKSFWMELPKMFDTPLDFTPRMYLTARPIDTYITAQWLKNNVFPASEIRTVGNYADKLMVMEHFPHCTLIDDHYPTVKSIVDEGLSAVLFTSPSHRNIVIDPKIKVISSIEEINRINRELEKDDKR